MAWEVLVKKDADVNDTIKLIIETINKYSKSEYVEKITASLLRKSSSLNNFYKSLFDFVCNRVKYQLDPVNHERIMIPERLIREGAGDCKKMTVFIASVLKCAGIEPLLKVISYDGENYEHIYVIVNNGDGTYITLDPVNKCRYNEEIPHLKARIIDLNNNEMPKLSLLGKYEMGKPVRKVNQLPQFPPWLVYLSGPKNYLPGEGGFLNYLNGATSAIDSDINLAVATPADQTEFIITTMANWMVEQKNPQLQPYLYKNITLSGFFDDAWDNIKNAVGGLGDTVHDTVGNPQTWQNLVDGLKDVGGQILGVLAKVGLAAARGAFLLVLDVNLFGLADTLYNAWQPVVPQKITPPQKDIYGRDIPGTGFTTPATWPHGERIKNWWTNLGGDPNVLKNSIIKGTGKPSNSIGLGLDPATVTAASVLIVSVTKLLSDLGVLPSSDKDKINAAVLSALKTSAQTTTQPTGTAAGLANAALPGFPNTPVVAGNTITPTPSGTSSYLPWVLGVLGLGAVYKLTR